MSEPAHSHYFAAVTVLEVIQRSAQFLARKGVDAPRLQIELLLAHVLKQPRLRLYLDFERQLATEELDRVRQLVNRRARHEPLQHIIGSTSFCGLDFQVTPDVFIPRPETEGLAEAAWQFLEKRAEQDTRGPSILDFGTGSGCLAITLARRIERARVVAVDISPAALKVARDNAARHGVAERIEFIESECFAAISRDRTFDLIVSNPPYIPSVEIDQLAPEVRDYDPRLALDGGPDGLQFIRMLAGEAATRLTKRGRLQFEFGDGQADRARQLFEESGWKVESVVPDLSGRARILIASRPES